MKKQKSAVSVFPQAEIKTKSQNLSWSSSTFNCMCMPCCYCC